MLKQKKERMSLVRGMRDQELPLLCSKTLPRARLHLDHCKKLFKKFILKMVIWLFKNERGEV